jgi:TPR repeat protein
MFKAAEVGVPEAEYLLSMYYSDGINGFPKDQVKSVEWLHRAASHGEAGAQNDLGVVLLEGQLAPKDKNSAIWWFRKAAEQGHVTSQNNIGYACQTGEAGYTDLIEAYVWYCLSSRKGEKLAEINLKNLLPLMTSDEIATANKLFGDYSTWIP